MLETVITFLFVGGLTASLVAIAMLFALAWME
jgi:hypothetical protein